MLTHVHSVDGAGAGILMACDKILQERLRLLPSLQLLRF